jgi:hypothetical protein
MAAVEAGAATMEVVGAEAVTMAAVGAEAATIPGVGPGSGPKPGLEIAAALVIFSARSSAGGTPTPGRSSRMSGHAASAAAGIGKAAVAIRTSHAMQWPKVRPFLSIVSSAPCDRRCRVTSST